MGDSQKNEFTGATGAGTPGTYSTNPEASVGRKASSDNAGDHSQSYDRAAERGREALRAAQEHGREYLDEGRRRGERYYDEARERAEQYYEDAADWARHNYEHASDWAHDRYSDAARYGRERYRSTARLAYENPLLVGVVALAAGMIVGALLPRTRREDRTMGPLADDMRRRGGRYARDFSRSGFSDDDAHPVHESEWRRRRDEETEAAQRTRPGDGY